MFSEIFGNASILRFNQQEIAAVIWYSKSNDYMAEIGIQEPFKLWPERQPLIFDNYDENDVNDAQGKKKIGSR